MIESVEQYLDQLKQAMADADRATIQDALADAEEHLTSALAASAKTDLDESVSERLTAIIEEYGSPKEIAGAYRIIERRTHPELVVPSEFYQRSLASRFVSVVYDPRAWAAMLYGVVSMLTGIIYFTWVITGLYLSVGLIVLIIGLPIAWLVLLSFRGIVHVEGRIVESLLGVRMPRRPLFTKSNLKWLDQLKLLIRDKRTWTTILYMVLQMPLGIIYFTVLVVMFAQSIEFVGSPILEYVFDHPILQFGSRSYHVSGNLMPFFVMGGLFLFLATLHVARLLGKLHGKIARAMLIGKN